MNRLLIAIFLICAAGVTFAGGGRMDRSKFQIGTYCLASYARTDAHVKDMKGCGIDFVYGIPASDRGTLDLCAKHGLGVIATGAVPFWHGMRGDQAGKMRKLRPLEAYETALASFADHPAIWMLDYVDEPSALDFPWIGRVTGLLKAKLPKGVVPYHNLYPNYASAVGNTSKQKRNQLGTATYEEHASAYFANVPLDYACFDFYLYSETNEAKRIVKLAQMHDNFRVLADGCRASGRSLWFIPQVNSVFGGLWMSENMLRFQAHLAMCYGSEVIAWACWSREKSGETADMPGLTGWWKNNVLGLDGRKTQQYAKLRTVNAELHRIGERYMKYRTVATRTDGKGFVVGDMVARDGSGRKALFVLAAADPFDERPQMQHYAFRADSARVLAGTGELPTRRETDGTLSFELAANAGALVEFSSPTEKEESK